MPVCTEKPEGLPALEALGLDPLLNTGDTKRRPGKSRIGPSTNFLRGLGKSSPAVSASAHLAMTDDKREYFDDGLPFANDPFPKARRTRSKRGNASKVPTPSKSLLGHQVLAKAL